MVSVSRLSELLLRDDEVCSNGRMDLGQANSDVTTLLPCAHGTQAFSECFLLCGDPLGVSDVLTNIYIE